MTAVRTRVQAGCFAVTASSQPILILNRFKQITVAIVDDFSPLFTEMNIAPEKDIGTAHLVNACIIYAFSNELGIPPGMFVTGDKALIDFIRSRISDDVEPADHEILIKELIDSWQLLVKHDLLKKYLKLDEFLQTEGPDCQFTPIGAFELFVHDYFAGCVRAFFYNSATLLDPLKEWTHLIFSNLHGVGLRDNRFLKAELFYEKVTKVLTETGNRREQVEAFLVRVKKEHDMFNAMWIIAVKGWVNIELDDIETLAGADIGLTDLLEDRTSLELSEDLDQQLTELRTQLSWPLTVICPLVKHCDLSHVSNDVSIINKVMKEVMVYAICSYAKTKNIELYPIALTMPFPLYRLAGKGALAEEQLMKELLVEGNMLNFAPFELFAIANKARGSLLQDCIVQVIRTRAQQEQFFCTLHHMNHLSISAFSVIQAARLETPSAITYQYRRLNNLVKGSPLAPSHLVREVQEAPSFDPEQENPADAISETLNLQKSGGCVIQ